jgi:hypothetical protein
VLAERQAPSPLTEPRNMRYVFGLVGVLVTIGIIAMIMSEYTLPMAKQGIQTKRGVEEWTSMSTVEGLADAKASIVLDAVGADRNRFEGFFVKGIVPGGAMANTFGLLPGDTITAIGGQRCRDLADPGLAEDLLFEAKLRKMALTVKRGNQELQLPPK